MMTKNTSKATNIAAHFLPLLPLAVGLYQLCISWRRWPDPLIDAGREIYIPWRLTLGDRLYADLAYFNGPLSPHFNAFCLKLFGTSIMTLACVNTAVLALITILIYRILGVISNRLVAALACCTFLAVFGINQLADVGSFNFIFPYSHEVTHGILLSLLAIWLSFRWTQSERWRYLAAAGFCLGLLFLTKAEIFLAGAAGTLLAFVPVSGKRLAARNAVFWGSFLAAPAAAVLLFWRVTGLKIGLQAVQGSWPYALRPEISNSPFYQRLNGLEHPSWNLWLMTQGFLIVVAAILLLLVADHYLSRLFREKPFRFKAAAAVVLALPLFSVHKFVSFKEWEPVVRTVPLIAIVTLLLATLGLLRSRGTRKPSAEIRLEIAFAAFALVLTFKVFLACEYCIYGFAHAFAATLLAFVWLLDRIPREMKARARPFDGYFFRASALVLLVCLTLCYERSGYFWLARRIGPIGSGGDLFYIDLQDDVYDELTYPYRNVAFSRLITYIPSLVKPHETFSVMPEGIMFNYLLRRSTGIPYTLYFPSELKIFGEENFAASLERSPPTYVFFFHRTVPEYRLGRFGKGFGTKVMQVIRKRYREIGQIGAEPFLTKQFGIKILRRNSEH